MTTIIDDRKPNAMMQSFWDYQNSRGREVVPLFVIRAEAGHIQPEGYVLGWSVSRAAAERQADKISNQGPTRIALTLPGC